MRNLVKDPNFAHGTSAWTVRSGGRLSVVDGHDGRRGIKVTNTTGRARTLALNDKTNTVASTRAGTVYRASVWLKATRSGVSSGVRLVEYDGSTKRGSAVASRWMRSKKGHRRAVAGRGADARHPASRWAHVTVRYKAKTSGATLDLDMLTWALPAHRSFVVSAPRLVKVSTPPTRSTPTTAAPAGAAPTSPPPTPPPVPPVVPAPAGYRLVWSDDFSSLDGSKWNVRNNSWANNEESIVTARPDNVFVSNGALTLRALKESYTVGSTTRQYTSGYLDTIGKAAWQYGRIEMRAKLPAAQGMWPAFWLRENSGLGELDIMEAVGGMGNRTVQTVHQSTNGDMARFGHEDVLPSGTFSDWHTYAVDREPGSVQWYVDDRLVFSKTVSAVPWLDDTFDTPMNIRLNLQVGGSMPAYYQKPVIGAPLGASDYVIDYVRVYQR
ncbi:family 16 glycosylhydrolase [Nocardioides panacis]|uniref:Family 16 glycosylhydrolase n=1 Tax=Nocardioides panacis TaxID=2849501 RepID=A0A975Y1M4_9ACTN|nr:family 16 glycosylhydrolase [Nocardioides panacis]QWZ09665.1 family 16 glycosylhydrolase [Nocardioides panacis]